MPESLSLVECVVLGLLVERPRHGFSLVKELAADGEIGQVWSVPNPVVYRAVRSLQAAGLVVADRPESSPTGPARVLLRPSGRGTRQLRRWLGVPVDHFRDVRSELQVKLALTVRLGLDPTPLLHAQHAAFRELQAGLSTRSAVQQNQQGYLLWLWREESAKAVMRFLERALAGDLVLSGQTDAK